MKNALLGLGLLVLAVAAACSSLDAEAQEIAACQVVQQRVRQELAAPGSADFPRCGREGVTVKKLADGIYRVSSYVDAQNRLGAVIRSEYTATARMVGAESDGTRWDVSIDRLDER